MLTSFCARVSFGTVPFCAGVSFVSRLGDYLLLELV